MLKVTIGGRQSEGCLPRGEVGRLRLTKFSNSYLVVEHMLPDTVLRSIDRFKLRYR